MDRIEELGERSCPSLFLYVKRVAMVGSHTRVESTPESELDVLIELRPTEQRPPLGLKWFGLEGELRNILGDEVELVAEDALSPYLRPYANWEMVVLHDEG